MSSYCHPVPLKEGLPSYPHPDGQMVYLLMWAMTRTGSVRRNADQWVQSVNSVKNRLGLIATGTKRYVVKTCIFAINMGLPMKLRRELSCVELPDTMCFQRTEHKLFHLIYTTTGQCRFCGHHSRGSEYWVALWDHICLSETGLKLWRMKEWVLPSKRKYYLRWQESA